MRLKPHQWAAATIAFIVSLAEVVIVYDLFLAGTWLSSPLLSGTKTAAFVVIFIGSLIAEMQELKPWTRWLLFLCVLLLGGYQGVVNAVVNFHGAAIPASASSFFSPLGLTELQVKFGYAITDAFVRTSTVVIMWLVTGLVWRGVATLIREGVKPPPRKKKAPKAVNGAVNGSVARDEALPVVLEAIRESDDGRINQTQLAKDLNVSRQTLGGNWLPFWQEKGVILSLPGRGRFQVPETPVKKMEMPTFDR